MNRYPGIRPFRQDERPLFFGRNADTERLLRLVRNEQTVVLYGKSGYGKSSLLNAGLYPRLSEEGRYQFWEVRFGPYKKGESALPADAVCNVTYPSGSDLKQGFPRKVFGQNLWQSLKSRQAAEGNTRFILFFDQFEELFTYPPEQVLAFRQQLAEALYSATPEAAIQAFEQSKNLPLETEDLLYAPFELKVVFSIRADRMSLLKQLEDYLPNLLRHSFLLEALDEKQAGEAVLLPAALPQFGEQDTDLSIPIFSGLTNLEQPGVGFDTPPFSYAPETLAAIFRELRDDSGRIETSALQIVCKHVEDNIVAKRYTAVAGTDLTTFSRQGSGSNLEAPKISISPADLGDLKAVFRAFYDNTIAALDPAEQPAARRLVEDVLIKDGIRLPFAEQALLTEPGVTPALLEKLERASLLRVELDEQRRKIYEVGHDTLVAPIEEAAKARREIEAKAAELENLRQEAERQKGEKKKIEVARRRNVLVGMSALALLLFAFWKNYEASQALKLASDKTMAAFIAELKVAQKDNLATLARMETDSAQARADRKAEEAQLAAEATLKAMVQLGYSTEQVVEGMAQNAKKQIYELQYGEALGTLEAASKLKRPSFTYTLCALELAYFYNEAGQDGACREALSLLGQESVGVTSSQPDTKVRQRVRDYIHRRDQLWFGVLERRYYPRMIALKGGTFDMATPSDDDSTYYRATVSDFKLAETETTFFQFALFCTATKRPLKPHRPSWGFYGDHAAAQVSWYDACLYANWLSKQINLDTVYTMTEREEADNDSWSETYTVSINEKAKGFRLPTEAEWQFAAGGGEYGIAHGMTEWAGTSSEDSLRYFANIQGEEDRFEYTSPTGHYKPNALGLHDMSGNVWEWCWDWYGGYPKKPETDWYQPEAGSYRVYRGGSWSSDARYARAAYRYAGTPGYRNFNSGFRLASSPQ